MPLVEFEEYVRVVRTLLDGAETEFRSRSRTSLITFHNPSRARDGRSAEVSRRARSPRAHEPSPQPV
jgi:hypothetical protein